MAIVGLPGVHVIASSAPEAWVRERLAGDLMGPLSPAFIVEFGHQLRRVDDGVDLLLVARALDGAASLRETAADHPRITRAGRHRKDVQGFEDETGEAVVVLGRGLGLRLEVSIEVSPAARGRGLGRDALTDARRLAPAGSLLFAQVAPANAASIRALLHAGFTPLGAEVLFFTGQRATS
jgi:GNAT superfamily N-acetyltransferase